VVNPRLLANNQRVPSLPCCLADALRVRCAALDETLRQQCGPGLMLALLRDIERLTDELRAALDMQEAIDRIRRPPA
jgi:hypothetical protein